MEVIERARGCGPYCGLLRPGLGAGLSGGRAGDADDLTRGLLRFIAVY